MGGDDTIRRTNIILVKWNDLHEIYQHYKAQVLLFIRKEQRGADCESLQMTQVPLPLLFPFSYLLLFSPMRSAQNIGQSPSNSGFGTWQSRKLMLGGRLLPTPLLCAHAQWPSTLLFQTLAPTPLCRGNT